MTIFFWDTCSTIFVTLCKYHNANLKILKYDLLLFCIQMYVDLLTCIHNYQSMSYAYQTHTAAWFTWWEWTSLENHLLCVHLGDWYVEISACVCLPTSCAMLVRDYQTYWPMNSHINSDSQQTIPNTNKHFWLAQRNELQRISLCNTVRCEFMLSEVSVSTYSE